MQMGVAAAAASHRRPPLPSMSARDDAPWPTAGQVCLPAAPLVAPSDAPPDPPSDAPPDALPACSPLDGALFKAPPRGDAVPGEACSACACEQGAGQQRGTCGCIAVGAAEIASRDAARRGRSAAWPTSAAPGHSRSCHSRRRSSRNLRRRCGKFRNLQKERQGEDRKHALALPETRVSQPRGLRATWGAYLYRRGVVQSRDLDTFAIIKESCVFSVCNPDPLPGLVGDNGVISGDRDFRRNKSFIWQVSFRKFVGGHSGLVAIFALVIHGRVCQRTCSVCSDHNNAMVRCAALSQEVVKVPRESSK